MSGHFTKRLKATRTGRRLSARLERHHPTMLRAVDFDELNLLDRLLSRVGASSAVQRYLFSRSGFSDRLLGHAGSDPRLNLVTPADIYA